MPKLMITPNGKIDTKALPEIKIKELEFIEAKTATEKYLVEVWKKILKIEKISINNDFFEIGGDSLCSIQLLSEIYTAKELYCGSNVSVTNPTALLVKSSIQVSITS
jgi:hypothetical protein